MKHSNAYGPTLFFTPGISHLPKGIVLEVHRGSWRGGRRRSAAAAATRPALGHQRGATQEFGVRGLLETRRLGHAVPSPQGAGPSEVRQSTGCGGAGPGPAPGGPSGGPAGAGRGPGGAGYQVLTLLGTRAYCISLDPRAGGGPVYWMPWA